MDDKQAIRTAIQPLAVLRPMTPEAMEAVPHQYLAAGYICIRAFPFRVGRESRVRMSGSHERIMERPRFHGRGPNNDFYLIDAGHPLNISREHFQLECLHGGGYRLLDRGSACGISVNGRHLAGHDRGGEAALADGDVITVGSESSPYIYRFIVLS
ncbi:FHA domain-containing protein [Mariprofundus erugo]|nr:FHA domain-containing protein [Mariprofundus erugo]